MEPGYFTESDRAEVVIARNADAKSERLKQVMAVLTRHIHAAVKEIEPTTEEWMTALQFLTATGQMCSDWRQEYILFSDIMGVSMLVDAINNRKPTGASESTVLGPFHLADAPELPMGANICLDAKGEPMLVRGRILDTAGKPIAHAKIDVWQANDEGFYDVQQKGIQPDFNLRGVFRTGADGRYWFKGVKPKFYPIPDDGPVGKLLGALGRHPFRPAHLPRLTFARALSIYPPAPYRGQAGRPRRPLAKANPCAPSPRPQISPPSVLLPKPIPM